MAAMTTFHAEKVLPPGECTCSICSTDMQQHSPVPAL